jgi:hypothetical protein
MFGGGWSLIKTQTEQQKNLVCRVSDRVKSLGHQPRGACHRGTNKLQYRYYPVGKERAEYGQHRLSPSSIESESSGRIIAEKFKAGNQDNTTQRLRRLTHKLVTIDL